MHPEIAKALVAQHREELMQHSASRYRTGRCRFPGGASAGPGPCWSRPSRLARRTRTAPAMPAGAVRPW